MAEQRGPRRTRGEERFRLHPMPPTRQRRLQGPGLRPRPVPLPVRVPLPRDRARSLERRPAEGAESREEALHLLRHVLAGCEPGWRPSSGLLERYLLALRTLGVDGRPALSATGRRRWLAALDAATRVVQPRGRLQRKLLVAAAIVECDPSSARSLLPRERSLPRLGAAVAGALARAALALVASLPFLLWPPLLRRHVRP